MQQSTEANNMRDEFPYRPDPELHRVVTQTPDIESPAYWTRKLSPQDTPRPDLLGLDNNFDDILGFAAAVAAWCRENNLSYKKH